MNHHNPLLRCGAEPEQKRFYMTRYRYYYEEQERKAQFERLWKTLSTAYASKYLPSNFLV